MADKGRVMNRQQRRATQRKLLKVVDHLMAARPCGECSACCTTLEVPAVQTKVGEKCQHQREGGGCSIYASRPKDCREYACAWKIGIGSPEQRPDKMGFTITAGHNSLVLHPAWLVHELWKGAAFTPEALDLLQSLVGPNIVIIMRDARAINRILFPDRRAEEVRRFVANNTVGNGVIV